MAQIEIRIKANEGADVISGFTSTQSVNNVSRETSSPTTENNGVNGKSWATGYLSLSDGYVGGQNTKLQSEVNKYNGYMFGATNAQKEYTLEIAISGVYFDKILLIGDKTANQFGTEAILDEGTAYEKTVYSDDASWGIAFEQESNSHTIKITKWNRANYNACFTTLKVFVEYLFLNKGQIDNLSTLSQSTSDAGSIQYGVLANNGSANIRDIDGELKDYIQDGIISNSNVPIKIFINGNQIQEHLSNDSDYQEQDKMLTLQFTNFLSNWDKLTYNGRDMTENETAFTLLSEMLVGLGYSANEIDSMTNTQIVYGASNTVGTVKQYLQAINIPYAYLEKSSYTEAINKICTLAQLQVFATEDNTPIFISARPIATQSEISNAIKIKKSFMIDDLQKTIVLKNKFDGININEITVDDNVELSTVVGNWSSLESSSTETSNQDSDTRTSTSLGVTQTNYIFMKVTYSSGRVIIPKIQNSNLKQIKRISTGVNFENNANIKHTITGKHFSGGVSIII